MKFRHEIVIDADQDAVWAAFDDPENMKARGVSMLEVFGALVERIGRLTLVVAHAIQVDRQPDLAPAALLGLHVQHLPRHRVIVLPVQYRQLDGQSAGVSLQQFAEAKQYVTEYAENTNYKDEFTEMNQSLQEINENISEVVEAESQQVQQQPQ